MLQRLGFARRPPSPPPLDDSDGGEGFALRPAKPQRKRQGEAREGGHGANNDANNDAGRGRRKYSVRFAPRRAVRRGRGPQAPPAGPPPDPSPRGPPAPADPPHPPPAATPPAQPAEATEAATGQPGAGTAQVRWSKAPARDDRSNANGGGANLVAARAAHCPNGRRRPAARDVLGPEGRARRCRDASAAKPMYCEERKRFFAVISHSNIYSFHIAQVLCSGHFAHTLPCANSANNVAVKQQSTFSL